MPFKPEDFPVFTAPDKETFRVLLRKLCAYIEIFSNRYNIRPLFNKGDVLLEVLERVEKRRIYFHVFHDKLQMGELNEGALICFWILKLHPFYHPRASAESLNACLAVCVLAVVVYYVACTQGKRANFTKANIESIYYAFRYRDLSKEAIMLLAESLLC
jgi:hypothetical protein